MTPTKKRKANRGHQAEPRAKPDGLSRDPAGPNGSGKSDPFTEPVSEAPDQPPVGPDNGRLVLPPLDPDLYINRELSWLEFNRRVLEEAQEETTPLLERVKFAAIFAENLDGWLMIRLAGLKRKLSAGIGDPGPDGRTPPAQFAAVRRLLQQLLDAHATLVCDNLLPALARNGVDVGLHRDLEPASKETLQRVFEEEIFPILTPQAIDRGRRFPHVSNRSLNMIVVLRSAGGSRFARVKIPATLPRLVPVPAPGSVATIHIENGSAGPCRFTWLEQVVAAHLDRLFPGNEIVASYPFHVTRDADIEVDEEDDDASLDLMSSMRESLSQRTFGPVVRLMVDRSMPEDVRDWLVDQLHSSHRDLYVVDGALGLEDLDELTRIDRPDLKDPPFTAAPLKPASDDPSLGGEGGQGADIFTILRQRDVLLHHPYQSFGAVVDFVRAASIDRDVVAIKQTLYRIGKDSPLVPALIEARDDDTQVAVLLELKARFDEENNITWAEQLEGKGVHVAYGLAGLKTHCKATLVVRREREGLRRYVHLATGNYNATTARVYEDFGLLSAREDLGSDVAELFNALTGYAQQERYRRLWVAPAKLRERFLEAIGEEIAAHKRTGNGRLIFKMNALVDKQIIRGLYAASRAGVQIDLIVRGVCCLRPGVPGWSETIRVISVVGRFLEHSRIYHFGDGGEGPGRTYLGSADLMERNLDRRVEAVFPVEDPSLAAHLRDVILPAYLRDTVNARQLQGDGTWSRVRPEPREDAFDVQRFLMELY